MSNEEMKIQEGAAGQRETAGRLFTQEEVNEIIKKRLIDRKKDQESEEERINAAVAAAIHDKETELELRSSALACREYVIESGLPVELLDALDTSDLETFKQKAAKLSGAYESRMKGRVAPLGSPEPVTTGRGLVGAFDPARKHTPRKYGA